MGSEQIRYGEEVDAGEGLRGTESSQTEEPEQERNLRKRGWGGKRRPTRVLYPRDWERKVFPVRSGQLCLMLLRDQIRWGQGRIPWLWQHESHWWTWLGQCPWSRGERARPCSENLSKRNWEGSRMRCGIRRLRQRLLDIPNNYSLPFSSA